jgi:hypothetical protein
MLKTEYKFEELNNADLIVDAVYHGGSHGDSRDDPFTRLLGLSNMGGFRYRGDIDGDMSLLMVLSTFGDPDWPDVMDKETGQLTYYGDNKKPGRGLHDTGKRGNRVLRRIFADAYGGESGRRNVPPTFVFARSGPGRSVEFLGLAVPGLSDVWEADDLVAVWKSSNGKRFQNYRANFSILDAATISRRWLNSLIDGDEKESAAPEAWREWRASGQRRVLTAERSIEWRSKREQYPEDRLSRSLLETITDYFADRAHDFEYCAVEIARMVMPDITSANVTRRFRDGGRDALGQFRIGSGPSSVLVDFALEAKCFTPPAGVGVRYLSRLISRLRHRQFGVLVTTTWLDRQAYKEIVEDRHPIVVISGADIVSTLREAGLNNPKTLTEWLEAHFSPSVIGSGEGQPAP